jgi:hypothetical protein
VRGKCVESTIIGVIIAALGLIFIAVIGVFIVRYKNYKNDQYVLVHDKVLHFFIHT